MSSVESLYLFKLAKDKSPRGRKILADELSKVFLDKYANLSSREQNLMFEILRLLVHDIEMPLRKTIAERLAAEPALPRNLAKLLANDAIEIAFPILSLSQALLDEDLIEIIRKRSVEHQLAITIRPSVSEDVTDAIVETGNGAVITSMLKNENAAISSKTFAYLVEESRRVTIYQEPVLHRKDLDSALAERMFTWVSGALRQYILDTYELDPGFVDGVLKSAVRAETEALKAEKKSPNPARELVNQLSKEGKLTTDLMIKTLGEGEVSLFAAMFHELTGVDEGIVIQMLAEPAGTVLAIACKSAGLDKSVFSSLYALARRASTASDTISRKDMQRVESRYDHMTETAARNVVARWRRNVTSGAAANKLGVG
ncbi:MAG: DUF2336 domain-containing protein [Rhodospirillales bacterium]|jgi:uncharacterized protein (DUF2336 family)|nr:DUF2336 domain-containing protein [Rhodospirillales bacterium]